MDFITNAYLSLAIGIAAVIGWIRFRKIDPAYHPFLFLVWCGFLHEGASIILLQQGYSNVVPFNLFILAEAQLLCWQFYRWEVIRKRTVFTALQAALFSFWAIEWALTSFQGFCSFFVVFYSAGAVALSIVCINDRLFNERLPFLRNSIFLL
jgi:hypothetical protein